jgi:hypothetical protein
MAEPTQSNISQTSIPDYAKPYVEGLLGKSEALTATPYQTYGADRIAGFTPMQQQAFQGAQGMQPSALSGLAGQYAGSATLGALGTSYDPTQFQNLFNAPNPYQTGQFYSQNVSSPQLNQYGMGPAERVSTESFNRPGTAQDFMSPYMQSVVDIQQREAQRQADIAGTQRSAQATGAGAFGGSRQAIMDAEAARNLAMQKGDIQATGQQAAFQNAQQQFNAEQNSRLQAALANQGAGLTVGQQNLGAQLGIQQLGAGQNMQAQLANQQYGMDAQRMREQSRQFGAGQDMTAAQQRAQFGQAAQQLGEQSKQFGAGLGLQGLQTALTGAGQMGQLGGQQFAQGMDINKLQQSYGTQQQQQQQNIMSQQYQDFLNQQNYPYKQLGFMSDMLRGLPLSQASSQVYQAPPSALSTAAGLGTAALGASKLGLFAGGGAVTQRPAGLAELAISRMA